MIGADKFKIQRKPLDGLTNAEAEGIRRAFEDLEQKNAKLVEENKDLWGLALLCADCLDFEPARFAKLKSLNLIEKYYIEEVKGE